MYIIWLDTLPLNKVWAVCVCITCIQVVKLHSELLQIEWHHFQAVSITGSIEKKGTQLYQWL